MATQAPSRAQLLYRAALAHAVNEARGMMEKMVDAARYALLAREGELRAFNERNAITDAVRLLNQSAAALVDAYPLALKEAFAEAENPAKPKLASLMDLRFDQLELMDDAQVQDRIELARAQQTALAVVEQPLAELNAVLSGVQGFGRVVPERNPMRPDIYIRALQQVIQKTHASAGVRTAWMQHMCTVLGKELERLYRHTTEHLRAEGVRGVGYGGGMGSVVSAPPLHGGGGLRSGANVAAGVWTGEATFADTVPPVLDGSFPVLPDLVLPPSGGFGTTTGGGDLLTVDRLRQFLAGELDSASASALKPPGPAHAAPAGPAPAQAPRGRPARGSGGHTDFQNTVPAAFDVLQEMNQVDQAMERLAQREPLGRSGSTQGGAEAWRQRVMQDARGAGQALGIEVVGLMLENIVQDGRLLPPVQQAVQELEPALMQLALVDPRFFSDREHPARRLLDELTQRSLAFNSTEAPGFRAFMKPLRNGVDQLSVALIDSAQPFEAVLAQLLAAWNAGHAGERVQREKAVAALLHAEQRNLLADKIRTDLLAWPDAALVPAEVREFAAGPWAQVIAQARLGDTAGHGDPNGYQALVANLFWSAQPELARANTARLAKLLPSLLARLREGLKTIDFPQTEASAFFEKLMALHQRAFDKSSATAASAEPAAPLADAPPAGAWLAPREAAESGYMDIAAADAQSAAEAQAASGPSTLPGEVGPSAPMPLGEAFDVGTWVELLSEGRWLRTQLTWASPHGTLFLFTTSDGGSQSMTRRMRDRLLADGSLRVVASQPVVQGALDAVAQAAMRNSLDAPPR